MGVPDNGVRGVSGETLIRVSHETGFVGYACQLSRILQAEHFMFVVVGEHFAIARQTHQRA